MVPKASSEEVKELSAIELMAKHQADINNAKIEIAEISQSVIENPEQNVSLNNL